MADSTPSNADDVRDRLHAIAQSLRQSGPMPAESRKLLADLVEELGHAVPGESGSAETWRHLGEHAAQLAEAIREDHEPGLLESARDRLSQTVVAAETEAPILSGIAKRFIQALSDLGI